MSLFTRIERDVRFTTGLRRLLKRVKPIRLDSPHLLCDDFEAAVDRWPDNVAIVFDDRQVTYRDLDSLANRYAHWAKGRGVRRGETVALVLPNRIEYLAAWIGFSKVGVAAALVNTNLAGAALAHSLNISAAKHIVADFDTYRAVEEAKRLVERPMSLWVLGLRTDDETSDRRGLDTAVKGASAVRPDRELRDGLTNRDVALYIYTSGTTGLPKAARITHARARLYMLAFAGATAATEKDRVYIVLPLYHSTGGLVGVGAALLNGASILLRKRFSATQFWTDVAERNCTLFVYIGELCRYLVNSPEHPMERSHRLKLAFGNGLRPDIWETFQNRFAIPQILEFYGSTEGNVSLFNFDGRPGAIGRVPKYLKKQINMRLIRVDLETCEPLRGSNGLCQECRPGEIGEAIGAIGQDARHEYVGYADRAASQKKVLTDVLARGDAWFRTGDLMRQDSEGYLFFIDRMGDTFRWKGENVSTTEVGDRLTDAPGVTEAIVYGVPVDGAEGKAGMVALVLDGKFDPKAFAEYVERELPPYARPVFVRLLKAAAETTGTFKYRRMDLVEQGYDPEAGGDLVYLQDAKKGYVKITPTVWGKLQAGDVRL